jgi:glutamate-1-semialdehyde 2,1-aminomutase
VESADSFETFLRADQSFYDEFIVAMLRRGQFLLPGGRWYLSTAHSDADIDETLAAARDALAGLAR